MNYSKMYRLRLRAKIGWETSTWVNIEFCAEEDADLGGPSKVNIISKKGMLEVNIANPMASENKSMRELQNIYFLIVYWKNTSGAKNVSLIEYKNVAILMGLEPWNKQMSLRLRLRRRRRRRDGASCHVTSDTL